jgi:RimJ/RimL family protein N-acetyltransferase
VVVTGAAEELGPTATTGLLPARRRSALAPVLDSPAYQLTPIQESDLDFLYALATHPETGYRWRYRGNPPTQQQFGADLDGGVLVQYVARDRNTGEPAGHVVAYSADLAQGHASVGAMFSPDHAGTGLAAEITALFVRYLFHTFRLHKLYLEVPGFNWPQVESGAGRLFQVEGVLREHDFYAGRYWDKHICAIYPPA